MPQINTRILRVLIFLFFLFERAWAQQSGTHFEDSLNTVLQNAEADTIKLQILEKAVLKKNYQDPASALMLVYKYHNLAHKISSKYHILQSGYYLGKYYQFCKKDVNAAVKTYENCAELAIEYNINEMAVKAFVEIAQAYEYTNNNLLALENYYKAIKLKPPPDVCQGIYGNLGEVYNIMGDYTKALYYYEKTYAIKHQQMLMAGNRNKDDTLVLMLLQVNIAGVHIAMGRYKTAIENYQLTRVFNTNVKNSYMDVYSLQGIGRCLQLNNQLTESIPYFTKALQISTTMHDNAVRCNLLNDIGSVYLRQNNTHRAAYYAQRALEIQSTGHKGEFSYVLRSLPDTYTLMAKIAAKKSEFKHALKYINLAINLYEKAERKHDESEAWAALSNIYKQMGNVAGAFSAYKRQVALRDSVFSQEKAREITRIEMTGEFDRKQTTDSLLQVKKDIQDKAALNAQKKNSYFFMAGSILLLCIAAGSIYFLIYTRKAKAQIELLMKEMHHRVKNNLQIISALLNLQLADTPEESAKRSIEEGITRISSIALIHHHLYQQDGMSSIEISGFAKELLRQVFAIYSKHGQQLQEHFDIPAIQLDVDTAIPLGLILNELMTNSFKHAYNNTTVCVLVIKLFKENNKYIMEYKDSGPGLPEGFNIKKGNSLGLRLIENLSNQLAGDFNYRKADNCFVVSFKDTLARKKIA